MLQTKISYVECSIPPDMTIGVYRSSRERPRRRSLRSALRLRRHHS